MPAGILKLAFNRRFKDLNLRIWGTICRHTHMLQIFTAREGKASLVAVDIQRAEKTLEVCQLLKHPSAARRKIFGGGGRPHIV